MQSPLFYVFAFFLTLRLYSLRFFSQSLFANNMHQTYQSIEILISKTTELLTGISMQGNLFHWQNNHLSPNRK